MQPHLRPQRGLGFTLIEVMVALLIVAVGVGAILNQFVTTARAAARDGRRAQMRAFGQGLIAQWQAMPPDAVRFALAEGDEAWPETPAVSPLDPELEWQWRWDGRLADDEPLALELHLSTDWNDPGETIHLSATL